MSKKGKILFALTIVYVVLDIIVLLCSTVIGAPQLFIEATSALAVVALLTVIIVLAGKAFLKLFYVLYSVYFTYAGVYDMVTGFVFDGILFFALGVVMMAFLPKLIFRKM